MFALADVEKFIYYLPGVELDVRIQEGMPIPPSGGIRKALETGETVSADIPKEIYGWPFKSTSMPIRKECLAQSERQAAATEEITAPMQQLAASAAEIEKIARLI